MTRKSSVHTIRNIMKLYDIIAKDFSATRSKPWGYIIEYAQKIREQSIIADLGCGNGRHTIPYAKSGNYTIALDISKEMLITAKTKIINNKVFYNVDLIQGSLTHLPLKNNALDLIMCIATLHHIPTKRDRIHALTEMYRTLNRNGLLIASVWNLLQLHHLKNILKTFILTKKLTFRDVYVPWKYKGLTLLRYYHLYTRGELRSDFQRIGIKKPKIYRLDISRSIFPQNLLVIVKKVRYQ